MKFFLTHTFNLLTHIVKSNVGKKIESFFNKYLAVSKNILTFANA